MSFAPTTQMNLPELMQHAERARRDGREVVLVLGLGFVGTAVAGSLVRAARSGRAAFFVVAVDREDALGAERVARLERGAPPVDVGDARLAGVLADGLRAPRILAGTTDPAAVALADVVVVCVNLHLEREPGQVEHVACDLGGIADVMRDVGRRMRPDALVLVESTLPVGACERVLYPALREGRAGAAALFAYCYERVMPGPDCLDSVHGMWRSFAGADEASADRAERFLRACVDVERFPPFRHKSLRAAEVAKLMENAYRATNIAFIEEWARLAERIDVDLFDVVASIRRRVGTHDNMMRPGLGVGGQCLPKDALLAALGARELLGVPAEMPFSDLAVLTNERMPLRAVERAREHFHGDLAGRRALLVGVTYLAGVADTRSSPAATVARALLAEGADVRAVDAMVTAWAELPGVPVSAPPVSPAAGAAAFDLVVLCLPDPDNGARIAELALAPGALVLDPWNTLGDAAIADLAGAGVAVAVYGRGDLPAPGIGSA